MRYPEPDPRQDFRLDDDDLIYWCEENAREKGRLVPPGKTVNANTVSTPDSNAAYFIGETFGVDCATLQ